MKSISLIFSMVSLLCINTLSWGADVRIASGGAFIDNFIKPYKASYEKASGNTIIITERGFKHATQALENGELDISGGGFFPNEFVAMLKKEGVTVKDPAAFKIEQIATDEIFIALNKANTVSKLSKEQLKGLFTGTFTNWKDVGGTASDVIVVWNEFLQGPNSAFLKQVMEGAKLTKDILPVKGQTDANAAVISTPEAITIYPSKSKVPTLFYPEIPQITRATVIVTKGEPNSAAKSFIDFIKAEIAKKK
jgi:phosphate transport system substrate-binding protein